MKRSHKENSRWSSWRFTVCYAVFVMLLLPVQRLCAQDALPGCPRLQKTVSDCDTLTAYGRRTDTLPFWEKMRMLRLGASADTIRIVHVGDSHIRGHIFPQTTGELLRKTFGALTYMDMGINGAFCVTFTRPVRVADIAALHPDLVILSFGTNESHNRRYNSKLHYQQMDELVRMLRDSLSGVPMLMTTPPGSYESFRQRRRRRTYKINPRTSVAVQTIRRFADANGLAVWDMYDVFGGVRRACLNWQEAKLMRPDHVHYLPEGYVLQGEMFYQALLKAYNDYCSR